MIVNIPNNVGNHMPIHRLIAMVSGSIKRTQKVVTHPAADRAAPANGRLVSFQAIGRQPLARSLDQKDGHVYPVEHDIEHDAYQDDSSARVLHRLDDAILVRNEVHGRQVEDEQNDRQRGEPDHSCALRALIWLSISTIPL